ncbi:MAG: hypothetical protein M3Z28_08120 [Candidatus Dormibacteraeota bacterium]|nr:hypothetical protein [Candidatus Dormibacteraeota bacterium]
MLGDRDSVQPILNALLPKGEHHEKREREGDHGPACEEADAPGEEKRKRDQEARLRLHRDQCQRGRGKQGSVVEQKPEGETDPREDQHGRLPQGQSEGHRVKAQTRDQKKETPASRAGGQQAPAEKVAAKQETIPDRQRERIGQQAQRDEHPGEHWRVLIGKPVAGSGVERGHRNRAVVHLGPAVGKAGLRRKVEVGEVELPGRFDDEEEVLDDVKAEKDQDDGQRGHLDSAGAGFRRHLKGRALGYRKEGDADREVDHPQNGSLGTEGGRQQVV